MEFSREMIGMLQTLADAPGASGFEEAVVEAARPYAAPIGELKEDFLRNLYIYRKENTGKKPVIMLDAHSDEVGLIVQHIMPNGCLRFLPLGSWNKGSLVGAKVLVRNSHGDYIPGIVATKPVHFLSAAEKASQGEDLSSMIIDIGATSCQEAVENFHVRIGEPVVPATSFYHDENNGLFFGKGFDCRIGCAAMLEALRRLEGKELPCDVIAVLSTQEELGPRNSKVTVHHIHPDIAIVLEGCPADDTFMEGYAIQTALKKGPLQLVAHRGAADAPPVTGPAGLRNGVEGADILLSDPPDNGAMGKVVCASFRTAVDHRNSSFPYVPSIQRFMYEKTD